MSYIEKFRKELVINNPSNAAEYPQGVTWRGVDINIYSLTKIQKCIGCVLCTLAIIALILGAAKWNGTQMISQKAAWIMVGVGSTVAVATMIAMGVIYLRFKKKIDFYLEHEWNDGNNPTWTDCVNYPEFNVQRFTFENSCGERFLNLPCGLTTFSINFYRTEQNRNDWLC